MELWFSEKQTPNLSMSARIKETLYMGESNYQEIAVVDTYEFGRMLVLDGVFQTSLFDEYIYHEMIAHVPLFTHPDPKRVLVIGGGDGGSMREVIRHTSVELAEMVEIDGLVVDVCKKYLPEISAALLTDNPRVNLTIGDGIGHMARAENTYDVIIVDCSDPIGPGEGLFTYNFYKDVYKALKPDGLFVQQTESPFYHQQLLKRLNRDISSLFPITRTYLAHIPLYPGGTHSFTIGSKIYDPLAVDIVKIPSMNTRYYNLELHKNCFSLPNFVQNLLK
ncbi:MAG: speE [Firmicutes bacterium]|nr:speE [Bacillota bacterium]